VRTVYGETATVVVEDYPADEAAFFEAMPPASLLELEPRSKWSVPMVYKFWACNELKSRREQEEAFTYDLVIRIRPDLVVGDDFTAGRLGTPGVLHHRVRKVDPGSQIGDQLFFGDSPTMDAVCGLYRRLGDIYATLPAKPKPAEIAGYWAEGLLHTHVDRHTDVTPVAFRTEPYNAPSKYRLVDPTVEKPSFEDFFPHVRDDLLRSPGDRRLDRVKAGCARALFHFVIGAKTGRVEATRRMAGSADADGLFDTRMGWAGIAFKEGRYDDAAKLLEAVWSEEHTALPAYWLGRSRSALGNYPGALAALDDSIAAPLEYDSQRPAQKAPAFLWRGRVLESMKRWEEAAESYATAAALSPESFETMHRLGRALNLLGRHHHACAVLQQAVQLAPEHIEARFLLASSMAEIGVNRPIVRELWAEPVEQVAATYPRVLPVIARAQLAVGRRDRARAALEAIPAGAKVKGSELATALTVAEKISPEFAVSLGKRLGTPAAGDLRTKPTDEPALKRRLRRVAGRLPEPVKALLRR
jgi:tetratricopeptide (TPR) repeat protein